MAKFWIFAYFLQKITIFRSGLFLWRHNYVTPWPIVLILVCMNREGQYLPIDTKINLIEGSVRKNLGRGLQLPPLVRRVTKNSLVRRGLNVLKGKVETPSYLFSQKMQPSYHNNLGESLHAKWVSSFVSRQLWAVRVTSQTLCSHMTKPCLHI